MYSYEIHFIRLLFYHLSHINVICIKIIFIPVIVQGYILHLYFSRKIDDYGLLDAIGHTFEQFSNWCSNTFPKLIPVRVKYIYSNLVSLRMINF